MPGILKRYANWLHLQYPGGEVERLPRVDEHYQTNVPGVYVVGDLAGVPLLKFSLDSGTRVVRHIAEDESFKPCSASEAPYDLVIIGGGASGMAAAREAESQGLSYTVLEASRSFATIRDFQQGKPIYTYPENMEPAGDLQVSADVKETLVEELDEQAADLACQEGVAERVRQEEGALAVDLEEDGALTAQRVIVAIGRSGNFRQLDVPGEDRDKVHHQLHDPGAYADESTLVVGGGDSAAEAAIGLVKAGGNVTLSYRGDTFTRPKPENVEKLRELEENAGSSNAAQGQLRIIRESEVAAIGDEDVELTTPGEREYVSCDGVFLMIGREVPLDFFRRSGIALKNDWGELPSSFSEVFSSAEWLSGPNWRRISALAAFFLFMCAVFSWTKSSGLLYRWTNAAQTFPFWLFDWAQSLPSDSLAGITLTSASSPSFYYTLAYSIIVVVFGWKRIRRRKTPYVRWQTISLVAIQVFPLFLLPEIILPYLGSHALLPKALLDGLFPVKDYALHGREYWRAYGLILAWPLSVYNVFTSDPLWWWLAICFTQTFVIIPGMIYFWGKGAYCGWICSCGALAETLGDQQRHKMPHGESWNKFNMAGQVILGLAFLLLLFRIAGWIFPGSIFDLLFSAGMYGKVAGFNINYSWLVDVVMAGMIGYGVYFWLSGRFWCRFLCPLAALMHIYAKFSRFRILADKKKCISCNVCTSVCHQGIDVMHYAQQGAPMDDPECVRCSACVQSCPTGVLTFGQVDPSNEDIVITTDELEASLTRLQEEEMEAHGQ